MPTTTKKTTAKKSSAKKATAKASTAAPPTVKRATATKSAPGTSTAGRSTAGTSTAGAPARVTRGAGSREAFAAGAARASGERARRRGTPLVAVPDPAPADTALLAATTTPEPTTTRETTPTPASTSPRKHRPQPIGRPSASPRVVAQEGGRAPRPSRSAVAAGATRPRTSGTHTAASPSSGSATTTRSTTGRPSRRDAPRALHPVPDPAPDLETAATSSRTVVPGVEDLVQAGVAALRTVVAASGVAPEDVEQQVARTLAFLRRRLTGDFDVDDFGFDEDFTVNAFLPSLRPLYRSWFRVEVRGIENIPAEGGGLVVSNHSGTLAFDSLMTQVAVFDETPTHRHLRMLGADMVFQTPVVSQMARKSGSTLAASSDAERLLGQGELVGVWPEGFKGIGKPFSERYKLQRFGRGGFVASAIRSGVPIIPCSIVGAEEIYPMLGNLKTFARLMGAPYAPVTPTWPLLGPLGLIPLPSKWIIEFGVPVDTADLGAGAADDPMLIFDLTDRVRETIQQTLYSLLMQRRSVFF